MTRSSMSFWYLISSSESKGTIMEGTRPTCLASTKGISSMQVSFPEGLVEATPS